MQPDPEERLSSAKPKSGIPLGPILIVIALLGIGAWYLTRDDAPPQVEEQPVAPTPPPPLPPAPDIPPPPPPPPPEPTAEAQDAPEAPPPPPPEPPLTLEESDQALRAGMAAAGGATLLSTALSEDNLVERGVTMTDVLSRGLLIHKAMPVPRPEEKFRAVESGDTLVIDPTSFARYDSYAQDISELDVETLVTTFDRARPLLEQAYAGLGYAPEEFDNAVIRALDRIIATPVVEDPPAVVPVGGIYKFADPALEGLAPVQKLLLRAGPDNTALIQAKAAELRKALLRE